MWTMSNALLSLHSLQEVVVESSPVNCSGTGSSVPSKSKNAHGAFWSPDKTTEPSSRSRSGMTYAPLTATHGEGVLTSFLGVFPVKTFLSPEVAPESTGKNQGSGASSSASFARFDPGSSSWKTAQRSLLGGWDVYSETWPRWGSMRSGECWERTMPELHTKGSGSGLSPTFPTPTANAYGNCKGLSAGRDGQKVRPSLNQMASKGLWATPTVKGNYNKQGLSAKSGDGLATQVKALSGGTKTPQTAPSGFSIGSRVIARDESGWPNSVEWWSGIIYYINGDMVDVSHDNTGETYPYPRETVIPLSLPTPTKNDAKNTGSPGRMRRHSIPLDGQARGPLNPEWVEWLMGWPLGWTDLKPLGMDKFQQWLHSHGAFSPSESR